MNPKFTINAEAIFISSNWAHPQPEMVDITNSLKYLNLTVNVMYSNKYSSKKRTSCGIQRFVK